MKKALIISVTSIIFVLLICSASNAAYYKQCEYLEKHQWGALEDITADWKAGKITTDECAIYGCYALAAFEPSRADREEKKKSLPAKYALDKKSMSADPFFFIDFLYDHENIFSAKALEEFRKSDWSDYEFLEKFRTDPEILKIIEETPIRTARGGHQYRSIGEAVKNVVEKNLLSPEEGIIIIFEQVHFRNWFKTKNDKIVKKYKIGVTHGYDYEPYEFYCLKRFNFNNIKLINLSNYFFSARDRSKFSQIYNPQNVTVAVMPDENKFIVLRL